MTKPRYDPDETLGNVGPYDLVPVIDSDRILIVDSRTGSVADNVEEGMDNAIIAATRQCNWDDALGLY